MIKTIWQDIRTPYPFRLGRCAPCGTRYAWPANKMPLSGMACPGCGGPLAPTTLLGSLPFTELATPPYRAERLPKPAIRSAPPTSKPARPCQRCKQPILKPSIAMGWCAGCFGSNPAGHQ